MDDSAAYTITTSQDLNTQSTQLNELFGALAKAQGQFKPAVMDKVNPHYKSKFASLTSVMNACREGMTTNGLAIIQAVESYESGYLITTILGHSSGQWISSQFKLILTKSDMQGLGSAISYARRYGVSAMLGIVSDEDDDANLAVAKPVIDLEKSDLEKNIDRLLTMTKDQDWATQVRSYVASNKGNSAELERVLAKVKKKVEAV